MEYSNDDIEQAVFEAKGAQYALERIIREYQNENIKKELYISSLESEIKKLRELLSKK